MTKAPPCGNVDPKTGLVCNLYKRHEAKQHQRIQNSARWEDDGDVQPS